MREASFSNTDTLRADESQRGCELMAGENAMLIQMREVRIAKDRNSVSWDSL